MRLSEAMRFPKDQITSRLLMVQRLGHHAPLAHMVCVAQTFDFRTYDGAFRFLEWGTVSAGQRAFDFRAPPVALAPEPPEESLFGLPGLSIFGAHLNSKHSVALLAATLFLGLKGFLIGACVWVVYKLSQQGRLPTELQWAFLQAMGRASCMFRSPWNHTLNSVCGDCSCWYSYAHAGPAAASAAGAPAGGGIQLPGFLQQAFQAPPAQQQQQQQQQHTRSTSGSQPSRQAPGSAEGFRQGFSGNVRSAWNTRGPGHRLGG